VQGLDKYYVKSAYQPVFPSLPSTSPPGRGWREAEGPTDDERKRTREGESGRGRRSGRRREEDEVEEKGSEK
jgi:hypothetical protein